ncbi:geraniol 8-hydroxylase-like [Arachis ipaensis]|uniref:geraniol 8-hydroxylase-like n=1 Tax=Arachis ipaensis TaxID=130454 RepID=UPI000A2AF888|nr:geraniol 8-hydroxylase-like [Arachis ipaensis]XP_025664660.1 geraniol 8-hydroxylase-like [Arachis hypogaea]
MIDAGKANMADLFPLLQFLDPQGIRKRGDDDTQKLLKVFGDIFDKRMLLKTSSNKNFKVYDDDLFVAEIETTTSTIEWAMTELVHNPKKMARVKEELLQVLGKDGKPHESNISEFHYINAIVKETFRLQPPVPFLVLQHKSKSMVEICGFKVPKDTQVLINLWAIGRNSSTWSDPNSFVSERFLESKMDVKSFDIGLIPFGAGRRMCPALPLAHRTVHFILASLLHYFDWKIVDVVKHASRILNGDSLNRRAPFLSTGEYHYRDTAKKNAIRRWPWRRGIQTKPNHKLGVGQAKSLNRGEGRRWKQSKSQEGDEETEARDIQELQESAANGVGRSLEEGRKEKGKKGTSEN